MIGDTRAVWTDVDPEESEIDLRLGEVELAPGASTLEVVATDLACNTSILAVGLELDASDTVAPVATLSAPAQVQVSQVIRATATASDDDEVASLAFLVDGVEVERRTAPPYVLLYNAPPQPGVVLEIRAVARDAAGNQGGAQAIVAVVTAPDETPPRIEEVRLPPTAAPGETVTARAEVSVTGQEREGTWLRVVLREGRKRQIRRTGAMLGHPVHRLIRVRIGPLRLGSLERGRWRKLTGAEIKALRSAVQKSQRSKKQS